MNSNIWRVLVKTKLALAGVCVLTVALLSALFAGFLSPYSPIVDEYRTDFFHPPASIQLDSAGLYFIENGTKHYVKFFVRAWRYRMLGFLESDLHLFGGTTHPVFLLGTDQLGRDVFSRILFGSRISLFVAFGAVIITTLLGLFFGGISGYYGGKMDNIVMRSAEILMSIPVFYLILSLRNAVPTRLQDSYEKMEQLGIETFRWQHDPFTWIAVIILVALLLSYYNYRNGWRKLPVILSALLLLGIGSGEYLFRTTFGWVQKILPGSTYVSTQMTYCFIIAILSLVGWAGMSRVVRGMVLSLRDQEFVLAAQAIGSPDARILAHHILPNVFGYAIVRATLLIPAYILAEVSLSFVGLGVQEPSPSWGNMLSTAQDLRVLQQYTWMLSPGLFLFAVVLAFHFVGEGLHDALNPKSEPRPIL